MKAVDTIKVAELAQLAQKMYGDMIKGVVDIHTKALVVDVEMHADAEYYLLEHGSKQKDLWGINLYPAKYGSPEFVEYDSMINIRPSQHNISRGVENETVREQIRSVVEQKVIV